MIILYQHGGSGGTFELVDDTSPQLGADLDAQGNDVTSMGDITFKTGAQGGVLRTGTANADKFVLAAYDVDDGVYRTVIELDAGNTVVMQLIADYLAIEDATDTTKHVEWDLSGATTGTATTLIFSQTANRNITFPNVTGTVLTDQAIGSTVQAQDAELAAIAALTSAADQIIYFTGSGTAALNSITNFARSFIENSTSALAARSELGLEIGLDVQAYDDGLADIAGLAVTDGNIIVGDGLNWVAESGATARTSLGLGTLATQSGTFSGGGTLATGGFTLTVPATGTAALLGAANTFTATNTFNNSVVVPDNLGIVFAGQTNTGFTRTSAYTVCYISDGWTAVKFGRASGDVGLVVSSNGYYRWGSTTNAASTIDTWLGRPAAATVQMGVDAASPIAQTFKAHDGSGTNIAGSSMTIAGGRGTGTGAGGSVLIKTSPAGVSGSSTNALVTAAEFDDQPTGGDETRFLLYDLSDSTLKRVTLGADDSGGAGFKVLRVAN